MVGKPSSEQKHNCPHAGPDPDFQSIWPPHLLIGICVIAIQMLLIGAVNASWLIAHPQATLPALILLGVAFPGFIVANFLVTRGRTVAVYVVRAITCIYAVMAAPFLWHEEYAAFGVLATGAAAFHLWLTFTAKYYTFVMYYKVVWERYHERRAKAEALRDVRCR